MVNEIDEIVKELFESLLQRYQERLEESMKGCEFIFDIVDLLCYKLNKVSLNRGRPYIESPEWLENKKATIYPKNKDGKCFRYALTVTLNYQNIKNNPERISKIKPFTDQYNWKEISFPSNKEEWKKVELNNKSIALIILFVPYNTEEIRLLYKSKYNLKCKNQVILLMNTDGKKWHHLAVKKLSALRRGVTSKYVGDLYCLNCFHSYNTKKKLTKLYKVSKNHDYCYVEMSQKENKTLKYNPG